VENIILSILEHGGLAGAVVVIVVLLGGFYLAKKGWLTSSRGEVVSSSQLSELKTAVSNLDTRVTMVEGDMKHLPTRDEFHELQIAVVRTDERMTGLEKTTTATNHAVLRIEDFMINTGKKR